MNSQTDSQTLPNNDATLVMCALGGDKDAFKEIVVRYQNLLCSLAYSSVGDLKHSEDIAQETFVEAWKQLDTLSEPGKLKAWLCGILRFKISRFRRKERNQPTLHAAELDGTIEPVDSNSELDKQAIEHQQQALMWQALDNMDATYREPLVLFYREQQSVETVASELDLTVATTKQRLSRGRKLLQQAMTSVVENALEKSKPGAAFTAAVLVAINGISPPAQAAAIGASAGVAKSSSFIKMGSLLTLLASFSGLISSYFGVKAGLAQSRTARERRLVITTVARFFAVAAVFTFGLIGSKYLAFSIPDLELPITIAVQIIVVAFIISYVRLSSGMISQMQQLRADERLNNPSAFEAEIDAPNAAGREYRSSTTLFGVPLVHFQFGMPESSDKPAFGWIAGGSYARGLLFAWGGIAVAPISVGIIACGIFNVGAIGLGLFSTGTVAIGVLAFGAAAIGYKAFASLSALGWESAISGGFAVAQEAAIGPIALANQVNNELAARLANLSSMNASYQWVLAAIALLVIVPAAWHSRTVVRRMKRQ